MYISPKKKVTYLEGQVGDQVWKFSRHWVKAGHIGHRTGHNVEPWKPAITPPELLILRLPPSVTSCVLVFENEAKQYITHLNVMLVWNQMKLV